MDDVLRPVPQKVTETDAHMLEINWNQSRRDLRQFAALWLPVFAAIAGSPRLAIAIWSGAAIVAVLGALRPQSIRPLFVGWMAAAYPVGWLVSHLVLGITYFGLFTLVGTAMRLFRYDPMDRGRASVPTYWKRRAERTDAALYFRQF